MNIFAPSGNSTATATAPFFLYGNREMLSSSHSALVSFSTFSLSLSVYRLITRGVFQPLPLGCISRPIHTPPPTLRLPRSPRPACDKTLLRLITFITRPGLLGFSPAGPCVSSQHGQSKKRKSPSPLDDESTTTQPPIGEYISGKSFLDFHIPQLFSVFDRRSNVN